MTHVLYVRYLYHLATVFKSLGSVFTRTGFSEEKSLTVNAVSLSYFQDQVVIVYCVIPCAEQQLAYRFPVRRKNLPSCSVRCFL